MNYDFYDYRMDYEGCQAGPTPSEEIATAPEGHRGFRVPNPGVFHYNTPNGGAMNRKTLPILFTLFALFSGACLATRLATPPTPTRLPPTPLPPTPTAIFLSRENDCPTGNAQAMEFYNQGNILVSTGKQQEAEAAYKEAIVLDPTFCDAMINLGAVLQLQGRLAEAILQYQNALLLSPDSFSAHLNLATAYGVQGEMQKALDEYQVLVDLEPANPAGYAGQGNIYIYLYQYEQSIPPLEKAEELYLQQGSPDVVNARYGLGIAYYETGQVTRSRDTLETIYPDMPENGWVNYYLGLCYLTPELKDLELARQYIDRAQQLGITIPAEVRQSLEE